MTSLTEIYGEVISSYSRAQALRDGALVDVGSRERMFRFPVAMTARAYADTVAWDAGREPLGSLQDESGRLHDVLWMAMLAAKRHSNERVTRFELVRVPRGSRTGKPQLVELEAVCGPGDDFEPVITIQFPGED